MANKKHDLADLREMRSRWTEPLREVIDDEEYLRYLLQKQAVDMYIDGFTVLKIQDTTGIYASRLTHLIDKCMKAGPDGEPVGYSGLLDHSRKPVIESEQQKKKFERLIVRFPSLKDFLAGNYFGDRKYTPEKNMSLTTLHSKFLTECTRLGILPHEYPFYTKNRAYVSMCAYIHRLESKNLGLQMKRMDKDDKHRLASTGHGDRYSSNALFPFSAVQIDGHIIDMVYTVEIRNEDGSVSSVVATRAWLIAVIDVATRCILGYTLSQEFNYDQYDVMDAIKDAIGAKELKDLTIPGISYPANGGFYSTAFPELENVLFDTVMLDNAKSHLSSFTLGKLVDELFCTVSYGSVATPETRGIVERFFSTIETCGFHKLPMTTGSTTSDPKRNNPEKSAIKCHVTFDQIEELIDVLIARYNNSPHKGLDNLSPLESMRIKIYEAGMMPVLATEDMIGTIKILNYRTEERTVRGHIRKGKRPYIQFLGVEYRSRQLESSEMYLGMKIRIVYDPRDISTLKAYTPEGRYIGELTARGEFGTKSHSVKTRRNALKLARERGRAHLEFDTPIEAYMQHLEKEGRKSRRAATKSDIVRRETGRQTPDAGKSVADNIIEFGRRTDTVNKLSAEDIRDLSPDELYRVLFEEGGK